MSQHACSDCDKTKELILSWVEQQGHERCWYYPELFEQLIALHGIKSSKPRTLPPRKEFEEGCRRYQETEYGTSSPSPL